MSLLKKFAALSLVLAVAVVAAPLAADACDGKTATKTASTDAHACDAACMATCTASAKTASAASASCASKAAATKVASASCASSAKASAADMRVETVRMPSGALAVMYHGQTAETVSYLQSKSEGCASQIGCTMATQMVSAENCKVEMAKISDGIMMMVTSEDANTLDKFEEQYKVAMAEMSSEEQGD